jgi:hypothetical protein
LLAGGADTGEPPRVTAREEAMAPMAARAAATRNNKQKIRRHGDGENVDAGFEFVIIGLAGALIYCRNGRTPEPPS